MILEWDVTPLNLHYEITITITNPQFTFAHFAMQGLKKIVNFIFFALLVDTPRRSMNKVCSCFEDSRLFPSSSFYGKVEEGINFTARKREGKGA